MNSWRNRIKGLIAASAGGITASFAPMYVDPEHFISERGAWKKLGLVMLIGAVTHAVAYIQRVWGKYTYDLSGGNQSNGEKK
jgi:hypothetical protein